MADAASAPAAPGVSASDALLQCIVLGAAFVAVAPLCRALLRAPKPSSPPAGQAPLRRNEPSQILARIAGTAAVCAFAWVPLWLALGARYPEKRSASALLSLLGLGQASMGHHLRSAALSAALACLLLLGVSVDCAADALAWMRAASRPRGRPRGGQGPEIEGALLRSLRNFLAAPLAEEVVFRGCMVPLLAVRGGLGGAAAMAVSSLLFGLAHTQHLGEILASKRRLRSDDLAAVGTQVAFTTIFGYLASALFVSTGSLLACFSAHAACNLLGAPDFPRVAGDRRYAALTGLGLASALALAAFATLVHARDYPPLAA